ncbi:chemotaxis protein CheW, partial [bacterium]|nr:chemotaxis protein CheW [bacterium]
IPDKQNTERENNSLPGQEKTEISKKNGSGEDLKNPASVSRQIDSEEKIRVGVNIMNNLMNLAGELVLGRNQLMQTALPLVKDVQGLNPVLQHVSRITTEMQGKIMQMRMQPVSVLFSKFHRMVRELAKKLGKEINLVTFGDEVELDKTIIEALSDPMTHLIRNCCDHAIEKADEREKAGKLRQGTIELRAFHQAGQVHLEVIDDGAGINGEKVAQKALEKNIITESQLEEMSEREKIRLILKPGFSTAEKVSDVSGRGVGMDVVQTNISQLGGSLSIDSEVGAGTKLSLILPLTLAIVSGLVIRVANQHFIIPEANIVELVRIKPEEINQRINTIHDAKVLRLREKLLPLIDLKTVLNVSTDESDIKETTDEVPIRVLVARYGASTIGIVVDSLDNFEEIVVKPLPRYMKNLKSYSGASIMGNGKVSLILDIAGLVSKAHLTITEIKDEKTPLGKKETSEREEKQTLLLFDNKTDERFALPLELITRIERVSASSIEQVKDKSFMQYQGKELRLVFLEDYLPIQSPERKDDETLAVIVPKQMKHHLGLVVGKVYGTLNEVVHLDTKNIVAPGLFGSAILDGKITLLPDLFKLVEMATPDRHEGDFKAISKTRKKQVLLVDDTAFFRMIEAEYLTSAGYDVFVAENGQQALEMLDKHKVEAVVLDIIMPVMDGWKVIETLRGDDRFKDLPVMAVTSLGDDQSRERGLAAGFTEWESKLNKEKLLLKLEKMLA